MVMLHIYAKSRFISAKAKQPWISSTDSTIQSFNSSHSKPQSWPQTWLIDLWKTIASRDAILPKLTLFQIPLKMGGFVGVFVGGVATLGNLLTLTPAHIIAASGIINGWKQPIRF